MFKPSILKHWTIPSIFVFAALMLVVTLTGAHLAQAGGFNVDSLVTFTPLSSTYRTVSNTTGCPAGYAGKFTFTAQLTNKPTGPGMPGVAVHVQTLTNGNVLLDPQTNTVLGGQGAVMEVPAVGQYADGLLSADETVDVPFVVCLKTRQSFQFFVDVFGVVTELVSIHQSGTDSGNGASFGSFAATLSADGRFVAFTSRASDLVANDNNGTTDVFVRDLQTGTTTLVSVNRFGTDSGDGPSFGPVLSADGRFVAFESEASDLVAVHTNGVRDVFIRDLQIGTTTLVSINRAGTNGGNSSSRYPKLSADGRFVAFEGYASDLVTNDTNGTQDVFVRDLQTGTTTLVSTNWTGTNSGNDSSQTAFLSADGRLLAFDSYASDLVANDANGKKDVFVRDLQTGTTRLVSVNRLGTNSGDGESTAPEISADGRFVVFWGEASDLVANDSNGSTDVFVRDLQTETTTLVSINRTGTNSGNGDSRADPFGTLSANGRFVVFMSTANDLVTTFDTNGVGDVFVRDLVMGTTTLVSVNLTGISSGNGFSFEGEISADGRFVAFSSQAHDLVVASDTNGDLPDIFARDLQTGATILVSVNRSGTASGNSLSVNYRLSADGRFLKFESAASDLVANDTNGQSDIFVRPVQ